MKYIQYVNQCIKAQIDNGGAIALFGQNISAGSCIGGLCRGLGQNNPKCYVINTPNIENTLVGVGFGLMLSGVSSVFFMKQQDFLLLGIDHLVNTYNFLRINNPSASFTIVNVVIDSGYEGIQSSLNNFSDFCSIARIEGYTVTNKMDIETIFGKHLVSPGFRIIGVSQRLFGKDLLLYDKDDVIAHERGEIFQYGAGEDLTIACFNFTFPQGLEIKNELEKRNVRASLFSVNAVQPVDWQPIISNTDRSQKLVVLDDSKSVNKSCYHLTYTAYSKCNTTKIEILTRELSDSLLRPHAEEFKVSADKIIEIFNL